MSYAECSLEVAKIIGRELSKDEQKQVGDAVSDLIKRLEKTVEGDDLQARVTQAIEEMAQDAQAAAVIEQRNTALNAKAQLQIGDYLRSVWKDDPKEGLLAILGNSLVDRFGSKNGLSAHVDSLSHNYVAGILSRLAKEDLTELAASGTLDDQIWKAMSELSQKAPDETALKKLSPEAVRIAKIFNDYNDLSRSNANKAGAWIKELPGYVVRRSHDPLKIQKAAGQMIPVNDPAHLNAWKQFVGERLDWEKSMPDVPLERRDQVLNELFQQFANGIHVKFGEGGVAGMTGVFNVGKRLSHERVLHFKTPEMEFEYHKEFGQGETLLDNLTAGLRRMARDTAIMRKLGPNAKGNLDGVVDGMKQALIKEGRGDVAKEVDTQYQHLMGTLWPVINGEASIPVRASFAKWSKSMRNVMMMADLGGAVLSGASDLTFAASALRYSGERTAGAFFQGLKDTVGALIGGIGKKLTPEQIQMASEAGILLDAVSGAASHFETDLDVAGRTSDWVNKFFKLNGLSWWQDRVRLGATMATAHRHASFAGSLFKDLPEGMQAVLRQFGISPEEWNVIRKGKMHVDEQGRNFLTPESVHEADGALFAPLLEAQGRKVNETNINGMKTELADKYRALFSEITSMATSEPGKVERAMMLQGTRPGTMLGEVMRHFWMYKSFTVSTMRKHLGRELLGYDADRISVPKAIMRMMSDPKGSGFGGMVNLIAWGTMMGYVSMSLKDLVKGREPRVPTDGASFGKILMASAAQSGSFGIYGDFLFGEMKSRLGQGPLETFLGPTYKRVSDATDLWGRLKSGDDVGAKAFGYLLNNAPLVSSGYSLFYTRWALDYMLVYRMQEMMNPGYLRRMEQRLKKEKKQEYIVPPSKVIPYGG